MTDASLRSLGWKPFFQQQLVGPLPTRTAVVRVSAHHGSQICVVNADQEWNIPSVLTEAVGELTVGDWLLIDSRHGRVRSRFERETLLYRKAAGTEIKPQLMAANIDTIFIVSSCNEDFNLSRIERYLAVTLRSGAVPVVVLTKADLQDDHCRQTSSTIRRMTHLPFDAKSRVLGFCS